MKFLLKLEKVAILFFIATGNTSLIRYIVVDIFGIQRLLQFVYLLNFIILLSILVYFWKKWISHRKLVILVGILAFFVSFIPITMLLPFPASVLAFSIIILFAPFHFIAPILGPTSVIYAYSRGLLENRGQAFLQVSGSAWKEKTKKYATIVSGVAIVTIASWPLYFVFHNGMKDNILKDDPNVGRIVSFGIPLAYSRDCIVCDGSKKELEINRDLECIEDIDSVSSRIYKDKFYNVSYIPSNMKFEVVGVDNVESYGIQKIGGSGYTLAILKDENGLLSTTLIEDLDDDGGPCSNKMTPHLEKLFRYIEKNGRARILATSYDSNLKKSDTITQQFLLNSINTAPSKYKFSNIEMMESSTTGMLGVAVDVDADSLVYLVASSLKYKIWIITGLDTDYQNTLTPSELPEIKKPPIYFNSTAQ